MTKEEIIEGLKLLEDNMVYFDELLNDKGKWIDVHELLFEAIEALEQQLCEDCISRAEAINAISHAELSFQVESDLNFENYKREVQEIADGILKGQVKAISDLPSIQPKPKTGHWIIKEGREQGYDIGGIKTWYIQIMCDKCGFIKTAIEGHTGQYHFCPNCGAKMKNEV